MNSTQKKTLLVLLILVVVFAATAFYFFSKYQNLKENPAALDQEEVTSLVAEVGKLMVLPEGEIPTIATVADPTLLRDQPFFKNAKAGDRVLVYSEAGRAILYDPVAKKIIEVAPITIGENELPQPAPTESVSEE